VYTVGDAGVIPPQAIRQEFPAYPGAVPAGGIEGVVEVLVDEDGRVVSATMAVALRSHAYNRSILSAAGEWLYRPATLKGMPVKFRKSIRIEVVPPSQ
jgi:TonB family protein